MKTYRIEITETLQRVVEVEADSSEEALSIVENQYKNEDIVLDENDFKAYSIDLDADFIISKL
ncbi:MAG: DpnD/PcfM family protein [Bacteroidales bacterium]|nr:DpnD/PcfM family protein [Bacteroidales bacterium]MDD4684338.1 DpnD/PcfM family protein [Bacteroidales bacterium]